MAISYATSVASPSWRTSLSDGWDLGISGSDPLNWLHTLDGGFWDIHNVYSTYGDVCGCGKIEGDYLYSKLWEVVGSICGCGYISGVVDAPEVIHIFGSVCGEGYISNKINYNRQGATFPELRINDTYLATECPVAALEFVGFNPEKVINVISKADDLFENTEAFQTTETLIKADVDDTHYPLTHYTYDDTVSGKINYLVTDITTDKQAGTPLFYQYELLFDAKITQDSAPLTLYKNNESVVPKENYAVQYSYDLVINSGRYSDTIWTGIKSSQTLHRVRLLLPVTSSNPDDFYIVTYQRSVYNAVTDQRELIDLQPVYGSGDFTVDSSGVVLTATSKIDSTTPAIYIVKDPEERIEPIGIEPPVYQPDGIHSWNIRFNPGSLFIPSGVFSGSSKVAYKLTNQYNASPFPIANVNPSFISDNILKVDQAPIYIDESTYTYPQYQIPIYNRTSLSLVQPSGQIGISINGATPSGLKITSIDRDKGYIQLNRVIDPTAEIELDYYVDNTEHIVVNNLELNPKATGVLQFHISGYMDGMSLALRPYDSGNLDTELLYIYDTTEDESTRICQSIPAIGGTPTGIAWTDESFFTLCDVNLNRLTKDIVKVTDTRQVTGIQESDLTRALNNTTLSGLDTHEVEWYSDKGYYGGEPLAFGGTMVIHVPSGTFFGARDAWIAEMENKVEDIYEAQETGTREFNFYMDQVIKRYISGGTSYIIVPIDNSGNFMDIVRLDY